LTQALQLECHVELAELCEALGLRTQRDHDFGIVDATHKRMHRELAGRNVFFDVAEELRDTLIDIAKLHLGVILGEALLGDELSAGVPCGTLEQQDRFHGGQVALDEHQLAGLETLDALLCSELVDDILHLFNRIPTHDFLLPALCRRVLTALCGPQWLTGIGSHSVQVPTFQPLNAMATPCKQIFKELTLSFNYTPFQVKCQLNKNRPFEPVFQ